MAGALGGGFTSGMLESQLDIQNIQMGQQKLEMGKYALAEAPIKLQEEQINLQKEKMSLAQQVQMLSLMHNLKPPDNTAGGVAGYLSEVGLIQMQSGQVDAGGKTLSEASRIQENASKIDSRSYRMQNDRFSKFANVLAGSPDTPQGFQGALAQMVTDDPGVMKDPKFQALVQMAQRPPGDPQGWHPGLARDLERSVLTMKEQAEVDYRQKAGIHAEAAAEVDRHRVGLIDAQKQLDIDKDKKLRKDGVLAVKAGDLKLITDQANRDHPGADEFDVRVRSRDLTKEMLTIMRKENVTKEEAAVRAYERNKSKFAGLRTAPIIKGSKPDAPLTIPAKAKSAADLGQNQWYDFNGVSKLVRGNQAFTKEELAAQEAEDKNLDDDDDAD